MRTHHLLQRSLTLTVVSLALLLLNTACVDSINDEYDLNEKVVKLIPFTVKAQNLVDTLTKATVNRDNEQLFESDDKLYITGEGIEGTLDLTSGGGKTQAVFSGTLEWTGAGDAPDPGLALSARLVSLNDEIGTRPFLGGIANSVVDAVQKYSTLTATSTYREKDFTLAQGTAFVECKITFEHAPADGNYPIVVTNNNKAVQIAEGTVNIRGGVAKFAICYPEGTVLNKAIITLDGWDFKFGGISTTLDGAKIYSVTKRADDLHTPLTMEAAEDGVITINNRKSLTIEYSFNGGDLESHSENPIEIPVTAGDKVVFLSNNPVYGGAVGEHGEMSGMSIVSTGDCYVYGNVMSLVDAESFSSATTLAGTLTFAFLFSEVLELDEGDGVFDAICKHIKNHPERNIVLPATTLTPGCYAFMFAGTSLDRAPELPAATVTEACYEGMFQDCAELTTASDLPAATALWESYAMMYMRCTSLTKAPELPAFILSLDCYWNMFRGCSSLVEAPSTLPATSLANGCYHNMFEDCIQLRTAPILPATTLEDYCYAGMFDGCSNLNYVKCLATDISAYGCTSHWLRNVAPTGTFVKAMGMNDWESPSVDGIPEGWTVTLDIGNALTLEAIEDGTISIWNIPSSSDLYYVKGGDVTRITSSATIAVSKGDIVQFIGDNDRNMDYMRISTSNECYVYGNFMSLLEKERFDLLTTMPENVKFNGLFCKGGGRYLRNHPEKDILLPATTLSENCYDAMFEGCELLTRAPVLPATSLTNGCYRFMFAGCKSLTEAPALPAKVMAEGCYTGMFSESGLTSAPELPARTLAEECYDEMFAYCESLTEAPALPATALAPYCYSEMFAGCPLLTNPPELPATVLAEGCYCYMFGECIGMTTAPTICATTLAECCFDSMFWGAGLTEAPELPWMDLEPWCYYGMFGRTAITRAPELPATTLAEGCYSSMFEKCTSLTVAPDLPVMTLADDCYSYMFSGCTALTVFPEFPATVMAERCYSYMLSETSITTPLDLPVTSLAPFCFEGLYADTPITSAPELPLTDLADDCYIYMFLRCTALTTAPDLPATTLSYGCYSHMFEGCASLTAAPALPATTMTEYCYNGMFQGCTSLTAAPVLPATTLADYCYQWMFGGCRNLNTLTCLANIPEEEWNNNRCFTGWLEGTAATGTLYKAADVTWPEPGEYGIIPTGWTVQDAE